MEYLIFSDESGRWDGGDYYIRAWIRITPENYNTLRKEIIFAKHEIGLKELKWKNFKKNPSRLKVIFDADFSIFVTISIPTHFLGYDYKILRALEDISVTRSTGDTEITALIKEKVISQTKNVLFFNYFDKQHIKNAKEALVGEASLEEVKFIVDKPNHLEREWCKIAEGLGIKNISIESESQNSPGIETADVIAGCVREFINGEQIASDTYQGHIKQKMLNMTSTSFPNPNRIFFGDFSPEENLKLNIFR